MSLQDTMNFLARFVFVCSQLFNLPFGSPPPTDSNDTLILPPIMTAPTIEFDPIPPDWFRPLKPKALSFHYVEFMFV